jgi:putative salt-induced outer membrane protein YdiY
LLGLLLLPWVAAAEIPHVQFMLRNGDRLTGLVVSETTNRVILTNAFLGQFSVPKEEIVRRELVPRPLANVSPAPSPLVNLEQRLQELQASYLADQITGPEYYRQRSKLLAESTKAANALSRTNGSRAGMPPLAGVPATALVNPTIGNPPAAVAPKPTRQFSGEVFAGMDIAEGSRSRQHYTGRLKLNYIQGHLRNNFDYLFSYGRTDGELSANRMDGTLKTDYEFTRRFYGYNQGALGYDEIRRIDDYFQIGPGAGLHLIKSGKVGLSVEAGANYQSQEFTDGREERNVYFRFAQQFKWIVNTRFSFDEKVEYFPQWDDTTQYKLRAEANVRYWLKTYLSLNLTVINLYDTRVASGVEPNDLQIRSSIGVKF